MTDGTCVLRAGLFGGAGVNTMTSDFIARYHNSQCRRQFPESLEKIRNEKVDITLGNHAAQNHTLEKYEKMKSQKDGDNPFIDSGGVAGIHPVRGREFPAHASGGAAKII